MTALIIIISVIILLILFLDNRIRVRREVLFNELDLVYDKMEIHLIKNKIHPNTSTIEFLKSYKFLLVNKGLADVKIMLCMLIAVSEQKRAQSRKHFEQIKQNVPKELIDYSVQFAGIYDKIINTSIWKLSFWWFVLKILAYSKYRKFIKHGKSKSTNIKRNFKEAFHTEFLVPTTYKLSA